MILYLLVAIPPVQILGPRLITTIAIAVTQVVKIIAIAVTQVVKVKVKVKVIGITHIHIFSFHKLVIYELG